MKRSQQSVARFGILIGLLTAVSLLWLEVQRNATPSTSITQFLKKHRIPGGVLAIATPGKPIAIKVYGVPSNDKVGEWSTETYFPLASLSKPITAATVRDLIAKDSLHLDDPALPILVNLAPTSTSGHESITIRHLLQHSSGLDRSFEVSMFSGEDPPGCQPAVKRTLLLPLQALPGRRTSYSNVGYCLLGYVIEHVSTLPYDQAVLSRLPSSARNGITLGPPWPPASREGWGLERSSWISMGAAGAWFATAGSVASILSHDALDPTIATRADVGTAEPYYGLGWRVWPTGTTYYLTHFGSLPGMFSVALAYPDGRAAVMLFNGSPLEPEAAFLEFKPILEESLRSSIEN